VICKKELQYFIKVKKKLKLTNIQN